MSAEPGSGKLFRALVLSNGPDTFLRRCLVMPPHLDIFAVTKHRDRQTIDRFLDEYVDRPLSEDRRGQELTFYRPQYPGSVKKFHTTQETVFSLTDLLARGLKHSDWAFEFYLASKLKKTIGASLAFTLDGKVVLGVTLDDSDEDNPMGGSREVGRRARKLLKRLLAEFDCEQAMIATEQSALADGLFVRKEEVLLLGYYWSADASK
jgi:hypothetical protein